MIELGGVLNTGVGAGPASLHSGAGRRCCTCRRLCIKVGAGLCLNKLGRLGGQAEPRHAVFSYASPNRLLSRLWTAAHQVVRYPTPALYCPALYCLYCLQFDGIISEALGVEPSVWMVDRTLGGPQGVWSEGVGGGCGAGGW